MKRLLTPLLPALLTFLLPALLVAAPVPSAGPVPSARKVRKTETVTFSVNIHCKNCVEKLTDKLSFVKGVVDLKVSLDEKTITIQYDPSKTDEATLVSAILKCGYTAEKLKP